MWELQAGQPIEFIQTYLRRISKQLGNIPPVIPDGTFGENTKNAVMAFQNVYALEPTGEVDENTFSKIVSVYSELLKFDAKPVNIFPNNLRLKRGDSGVFVYMLQIMIYAVSRGASNVEEIEVSGVYDENTEKQVRNIQRILGHEQTGISDMHFLNMLSRMYESYVELERF